VYDVRAFWRRSPRSALSAPGATPLSRYVRTDGPIPIVQFAGILVGVARQSATGSPEPVTHARPKGVGAPPR
jgi:hypothetical protein